MMRVYNAPDGMSSRELADLMGLSVPTIQGYMTELHKAGLVELSTAGGAPGALWGPPGFTRKMQARAGTSRLRNRARQRQWCQFRRHAAMAGEDLQAVSERQHLPAVSVWDFWRTL